MKIRYKDTGTEAYGSYFNVHAAAPIEVLTEDDSVYAKDLDVFLVKKGMWKDMLQAFRDHDLIRDNYSTCFFEPETDEERERGYAL